MKTVAIVSFRSAARFAMRTGVNPYDNHAALATAWQQLARKRGARA